MMTTLTSAFSILYSMQITLNNRYWVTSDDCRRKHPAKSGNRVKTHLGCGSR
jgi:hypothetical protein